MKWSPICPADLEWQVVDGIDIPVSRQFGDVYFSKDNGLLETRHVFLAGNDLPERLSHFLQEAKTPATWVIAELGFGTGLNFLATWQLWQQLSQQIDSAHGHLHFISIEKHPLQRQDLARALACWSELSDFSTELLAHYPSLLAGCHRIVFAQARITLDIWFGDAAVVLPQIQCAHKVDAWFLDGFAPKCNPEMWAEARFDEIIRLSKPGTSFASFSVAGIVKNALKKHGAVVTRPAGFGHKREMLKAYLPFETIQDTPVEKHVSMSSPGMLLSKPTPIQTVAVVGAGIAGLCCAYALARRGIQVMLFDEQPLSGASGNPVALLNPRICPIEQVAEHLLMVSWQFALDFYQQFSWVKSVAISQWAKHEGQHDRAVKARAQFEHMCNWAQSYPKTLITIDHVSDNAAFHISSIAVYPDQIAKCVLDHTNIMTVPTDIHHIQSQPQHCMITDSLQQQYHVDAVVLCNALAARQMNMPYVVPPLRAIRGQVSWSQVSPALDIAEQIQAANYNGYHVAIDAQHLLFGASFIPNDESLELRLHEQQHNIRLLEQHSPTLASRLVPDTVRNRAAIRAQTLDYLPLVGYSEQAHVWVLLGLGAKGFSFAPLCSELLVSQLLGEPLPVPQTLAHQLRPNRFRKKHAI